MQWASAVSTEREITAAVAELKRELARKTGNATADLVTAFVTPHYEDDLDRLPRLIADSFAPKTFIGCTAIGVIGGGPRARGRAGAGAHLGGAARSRDHPLPPGPGGPARPRQRSGPVGGGPRGRQGAHSPLPDARRPGRGPGGSIRGPLLMGLDYAYADATKVGGPRLGPAG